MKSWCFHNILSGVPTKIVCFVSFLVTATQRCKCWTKAPQGQTSAPWWFTQYHHVYYKRNIDISFFNITFTVTTRILWYCDTPNHNRRSGLPDELTPLLLARCYNTFPGQNAFIIKWSLWLTLQYVSANAPRSAFTSRLWRSDRSKACMCPWSISNYSALKMNDFHIYLHLSEGNDCWLWTSLPTDTTHNLATGFLYI